MIQKNRIYTGYNVRKKQAEIIPHEWIREMMSLNDPMKSYLKVVEKYGQDNIVLMQMLIKEHGPEAFASHASIDRIASAIFLADMYNVPDEKLINALMEWTYQGVQGVV